MLRFNYCVNLALATVLVVPAVTLGVQRNEPLEKTLARTLSALDQLAQVEDRLRQRDPTAVERVLQLTEAPLAVSTDAPQAHDEELERLRHEVQGLRGLVNDVENEHGASAQPVTLAANTLVARNVSSHSAESPTVGLDPAQLRALSGPAVSSLPKASSNDPKKPVGGALTAKVSVEKDDYSADALKLGRAYYKQGQYEKAREQLATLPANVEASYWLARSLERLGHDDEAKAQYEALAAREDAATFGERARADLELLQWRLSVENAAKTPAKEKP